MSLEDDPDFQYLMVSKKQLLEEQNQPFDGKKNCWVPDPKEGYLKAEIKSTKGDEVTVICTDTMEVGLMFCSSLRSIIMYKRSRLKDGLVCLPPLVKISNEWSVYNFWHRLFSIGNSSSDSALPNTHWNPKYGELLNWPEYDWLVMCLRLHNATRIGK